MPTWVGLGVGKADSYEQEGDEYEHEGEGPLAGQFDPRDRPWGARP